MIASGDAFLRGAAAVRVFACFAAAYFLSYALRAINAVIAPELVGDFGLSNAALGSLSSAYFLGFGAMQLPLGVWLDRYGSRRVNSTLLLLAAAGCALFAIAQGFAMLWIGRALIGLGVAGGLMSALKAYRFWYPPERQQQLAAWMLVAGTCGAVTTTVPVRIALAFTGWRGLFVAAAAALVACALAIRMLLPRDEERAHGAADRAPAQRAQHSAGLRGYLPVFGDPYLWRFAAGAGISHATFIALQSLWAGPWLTEVLGMTPAASARVLFVFNVVLMAAFLVLGSVMPRVDRAGWSMVAVAAVTALAVMAVELAIALSGGALAWTLWLLLAIVATPFTAVQSHVSLSFPAALTGRAYTAYNLLLFAGIFGAQWLIGVIADAFRASGDDSPQAFRHTLLVVVAVQALGLAALLASRARPGTLAASR